MHVLFVATANSVHMERWINQIADQGWEIFRVPVYIAQPQSAMQKLTIFGSTPPGQNS